VPARQVDSRAGRIGAGGSSRGPTAEEAWSFLRDFTSSVDAYVAAWREGDAMREIVAAIPSSSVVCAKEVVDASADDLAWGSVLADMLDVDRTDRVGGTLHVRPAVAAR
jgi:hypothetical protein